MTARIEDSVNLKVTPLRDYLPAIKNHSILTGWNVLERAFSVELEIRCAPNGMTRANESRAILAVFGV